MKKGYFFFKNNVQQKLFGNDLKNQPYTHLF